MSHLETICPEVKSTRLDVYPENDARKFTTTEERMVEREMIVNHVLHEHPGSVFSRALAGRPRRHITL